MGRSSSNNSCSQYETICGLLSSQSQDQMLGRNEIKDVEKNSDLATLSGSVFGPADG